MKRLLQFSGSESCRKVPHFWHYIKVEEAFTCRSVILQGFWWKHPAAFICNEPMQCKHGHQLKQNMDSTALLCSYQPLRVNSFILTLVDTSSTAIRGNSGAVSLQKTLRHLDRRSQRLYHQHVQLVDHVSLLSPSRPKQTKWNLSQQIHCRKALTDSL